MARGPTVIAKPVSIGTDEAINLEFFSDGARKTAKSIVGKTIKAWVKDAAAAWKSYAVTQTTALVTASGATAAGRFTLTGASHSTTGSATIHVHSDDVLVDRFTLEFVEQAV